MIWQKEPVKVNPWYVELHLGTHFVTLCGGIVAFFSNGGHLPKDPEGWITFCASLGLWMFGVGVSYKGAGSVQGPKGGV